MDEKDFEAAANLELMERVSAIEKARKAVNRQPPPDFDGTCPECGAEIPPKRIAAHYFTCVDCVAEQEYQGRLFSRR